MMKFVLLCACVLMMTSCKTLETETHRETKQNIESLAEAVTGEDLSQEEVDQLIKDVQTDEEAQSAIEVITDSMQEAPRMKYSPATGKRYSADLEFDPETGVKLEYLE